MIKNKKQIKKLFLLSFLSFFVQISCQQWNIPQQEVLEEKTHFKNLTTETAVDYRHKYLHRGMTLDVSHFTYDNEASTEHFAYMLGDQIIGIISVINESPEGAPRRENIWRLRGLYVMEGFRNKGVGSALLEKAALTAKSKGASILWGNARVKNKALFEEKGAYADSKTFLLEKYPELGKFIRMAFKL